MATTNNQQATWMELFQAERAAYNSQQQPEETTVETIETAVVTIDKNTVFQAPFSIEYDEMYEEWQCRYDGEIMDKTTTKRAYGGTVAVFKRRIDAVKFLMRYADRFRVEVKPIPTEALEALAELVTTATTVEETAQTQEPVQAVEPIAEEIATVAESLSLPVDEVAKVYAIAQEYSEHKQVERATFEAETKLETVPMKQERRSMDEKIITHGVPAGYGYIKDNLGHCLPIHFIDNEQGYEMVRDSKDFIVNHLSSRKECITYINELIDQQLQHVVEAQQPSQTQEELQPKEQERQVIHIERRSDFSMCGTSWFYSHPECNKMQSTNTIELTIELNEISHREVGSRATCVECGGSVHDAPEMVQKQETPQAYRHTFDGRHIFYYHHSCVGHRLPTEVTFEPIALKDVPLDAQCEYCYEAMHLQRQEEVQHMEQHDNTSIIAQIKQTVVASITDGTIPDGVYVDQKHRGELQNATALVISGHDINILYEDKDFMEGFPVMAWGIHRLMEPQPQEGITTMKDGIDIIQQEMAEQVENRDQVNAHIHADQLLVNLVNILVMRLGDSHAQTQVDDILSSYDNIIGRQY